MIRKLNNRDIECLEYLLNNPKSEAEDVLKFIADKRIKDLCRDGLISVDDIENNSYKTHKVFSVTSKGLSVIGANPKK